MEDIDDNDEREDTGVLREDAEEEEEADAEVDAT